MFKTRVFTGFRDGYPRAATNNFPVEVETFTLQPWKENEKKSLYKRETGSLPRSTQVRDEWCLPLKKRRYPRDNPRKGIEKQVIWRDKYLPWLTNQITCFRFIGQ